MRPVLPGGTTPAWFRERVESNHTYFLGPRHDLGCESVDYQFDTEQTGIPIGASCAYRREIFARYRYDPRLGPNRQTGMRGGEDTLLAMQLMRDGFRLRYCPDACVRHPVHPDRVQVDYVARAYFMQGVEWVRIRQLLGTALPAVETIRTRLLRLHVKRWITQVQRIWRDGADREARSRRLLFKIEQWAGSLAELRRSGERR